MTLVIHGITKTAVASPVAAGIRSFQANALRQGSEAGSLPHFMAQHGHWIAPGRMAAIGAGLGAAKGLLSDDGISLGDVAQGAAAGAGAGYLGRRFGVDPFMRNQMLAKGITPKATKEVAMTAHQQGHVPGTPQHQEFMEKTLAEAQKRRENPVAAGAEPKLGSFNPFNPFKLAAPARFGVFAQNLAAKARELATTPPGSKPAPTAMQAPAATQAPAVAATTKPEPHAVSNVPVNPQLLSTQEQTAQKIVGKPGLIGRFWPGVFNPAQAAANKGERMRLENQKAHDLAVVQAQNAELAQRNAAIRAAKFLPPKVY